MQERLSGYRDFLDLYESVEERLEGKQIKAALEIVKTSGALDKTRARLETMRRRLLRNAELLGVEQVAELVHKLNIPPQTC